LTKALRDPVGDGADDVREADLVLDGIELDAERVLDTCVVVEVTDELDDVTGIITGPTPINDGTAVVVGEVVEPNDVLVDETPPVDDELALDDGTEELDVAVDDVEEDVDPDAVDASPFVNDWVELELEATLDDEDGAGALDVVDDIEEDGLEERGALDGVGKGPVAGGPPVVDVGKGPLVGNEDEGTDTEPGAPVDELDIVSDRVVVGVMVGEGPGVVTADVGGEYPSGKDVEGIT